MFDIGFSELLVCGVVALIVIGPERMPEAVRTMGLWIGRFKRSLRDTRQEIERQIGVDDIRRQLHNEELMRSLEKTRDEITSELNSVIEHVKADIEAVDAGIDAEDKEQREKSRTYTQENELPDHSHRVLAPEQHNTAEHPQAIQQTDIAHKDNPIDSAPHTSTISPKSPL